jgi:CHASE3 domain sensor protein
MPHKKIHGPLLLARWPKVGVITAGLTAIALGVSVIIAWYAHWVRWLQIFPDAAPMQYNTALCFILCGTGLLLLKSRSPGAALCSGGLVALLGSFTLLEYLIGVNLGVDQLLFHPYFEVASAFSGRMAPLTALCFLLFGIALGLSVTGSGKRKRLAAAGLLATIVGMVGGIALLGYLTGMKLAYGWGAYSLMAIHTAAEFILLGGGLLLWCWRTAMRQSYNFVQWIPIACSATLIAMVTVVSMGAVTSLRSAFEWRKHTYEVLLAAQAFLVSVTELQRAVPDSALRGAADSQPPDERGIDAAPQQLAKLRELTRDNAGQQRRLEALTADLANFLEYVHRLNSAHEHNAMPGTIKKEPDIEGRGTVEATNAEIQAFIEEERRLLAQRSAVANADFHSAATLLGAGCALAAIFFVTGSLLIRREILLRHRVELELREANEKVDTLSGLLPMCANCKSIRDDKGYWTQIEAYLQERSDATFSHGLCEGCVRELYPGIADQVLSKMRENSSRPA